MNTELQHGHSVSVWQDYGTRGADSSRRGRSARKECCSACGEWFVNLKRHEPYCPGPPDERRKAAQRTQRCACGRYKAPYADLCPVCSGTSKMCDEAMARSRGITVEQLRERYK